MTRKITKAQAEKLIDELKEVLANVEKIIIRVIETEAWVPLGYPSFVAMWNARLKGIRLTTDVMKGAVVFAAYDSGFKSGKTIVNALGGSVGITSNTIDYMIEQREDGVPISRIRARNVWGVTRSDAPKTKPLMSMGIPVAEYRQYERIARIAGYDDLNYMVYEAVKRLAEIERRKIKRSA